MSGIWLNILLVAAGIAVIRYAVVKLWELNDDYHYYYQDVQRYIDSR